MEVWRKRARGGDKQEQGARPIKPARGRVEARVSSSKDGPQRRVTVRNGEAMVIP